jgi:hypothetical protein
MNAATENFENAWHIWAPNCGAAAEEGWTIADCDGSDGPPWQLQTLVDDGVFENDVEAWKHVVTKARIGDKLANAALNFLQEHSPGEYAYIRNALGPDFRQPHNTAGSTAP